MGLGPAPRLGGAHARRAFVGLLEDRIGKRILLALGKSEQDRSDRQKSLVEFENMAAAAMVHQYGEAALLADAGRPFDHHIMRGIGYAWPAAVRFRRIQDPLIAG